MPTISKSSFVRGLQCHKSLYLHFNEPALKDEVSNSQQHIFNIGHNIGSLAQQLFPGGIDASRGNPQEVKQALAYTRQLIDAGQQVIYEAAFGDGQTLCYMDILANRNGSWEAFEVKASTSVKSYHLNDVAFQYHVIRNSGMALSNISLVHLNNQYVRQGDLDIEQLFTIVNLTDKAVQMQDEVMEKLLAMQEMLAMKQLPDMTTGSQCSNPFVCDFYGFCHQDETTDIYTGIKGIKQHKINKLREEGVEHLEDLPSDVNFTAKEWVVLKGLLNDEIRQNKLALANFVSSLQYPLYFIDFETIMPAVPLYNESRPYQQIPFQYSLHIQAAPGEALRHNEFLGNPPDDPRQAFITGLLDQLGTSGNIIVYNQTFEIGRIRELARDFPVFSDALLALLPRVVDLMKPFHRQYMYMPSMKGSYSIKAVLPALVTHLSYKTLEIQEGGTASLTYQSLYADTDSDSIQQKRANLLEYCKMDTIAMVELLKIIS